MLRSAAVSIIQQALGFRTDKMTEIITALQSAQTILERNALLPWFLQTEISSFSTTSDEERVLLPTDFLREWDEGSLWYFNAAAVQDADKWTELVKDDLDELRKSLPGDGAPQAYSLDGIYIRIFPTPDAAYVLKQVYYKEDATLDSDLENDWLKYFPFLMIGKAGALLPPDLMSDKAMRQFQKWEAEGTVQMVIDNTARDQAGRRPIMGGVD